MASGIFSDFAIFYFTLLRIFLLYYKALGDSRNFTAEFINLEFQPLIPSGIGLPYNYNDNIFLMPYTLSMQNPNGVNVFFCKLCMIPFARE